MGTYLSTPVTDKCEEEGELLNCPNVPLAWGVVDMQGWRKSMEDAHVATTLEQYKVFGVFDGHGGPEVARLCQLYLVSVLTQQPTWKEALENAPVEGNPAESPLGLALRQCFHALDRVIADESKRDELLSLRGLKPFPGSRKEIENIPSPPAAAAADQNTENSTINASLADKMDSENVETDNQARNDSSQSTNQETKQQMQMEDSVEEEKKGEDELTTNTDEEDSDSDAAVGKEEASKEDQNVDDDDEDDDETDPSSTAGKVSEMFQRLLSMSGASGTGTGQMVVRTGSLTPLAAPAPAATPDGTSFSASTMHGGRMICTLPDHPIHAGATAVIAVIMGKTLMVANAGDSRAVLCREGSAFPLSYDHKPQQEREMSRIRRAGGFVNQFGRINGNLNLSRSIGDLKYKQAYFLPPADQMITAEPDILQTTIDETDEFIVIGCDGIWDCLTNQQAVDYVRDRITTKTPTEIGKEMLDDIISVDPRTTQGIGGDNMTIMIIDLQPEKRSYRQKQE